MNKHIQKLYKNIIDIGESLGNNEIAIMIVLLILLVTSLIAAGIIHL